MLSIMHPYEIISIASHLEYTIAMLFIFREKVHSAPWVQDKQLWVCVSITVPSHKSGYGFGMVTATVCLSSIFFFFPGTYILQLSSYPFQNVFCLFPHFLIKIFLAALDLGLHIASIIPSTALALMADMQPGLYFECEWTAVHFFGWVQSWPCWSLWGFCLWLLWSLTSSLCLKWVSESCLWQQLKPRDLTKCICKAGIAGNTVSSAYVMRQVNLSCGCPMVVTYTCVQIWHLFIKWLQWKVILFI